MSTYSGLGICLVSENNNSVPHYDVPFAVYKDTVHTSTKGIILRPLAELNTVAYASEYAYSDNKLGYESTFAFVRPINIPAGDYLFGYSYADESIGLTIEEQSKNLMCFLANSLLLAPLIDAGLYFNDIPIDLSIVSDKCIQVKLPDNVKGSRLVIKLSLD